VASGRAGGEYGEPQDRPATPFFISQLMSDWEEGAVELRDMSNRAALKSPATGPPVLPIDHALDAK